MRRRYLHLHGESEEGVSVRINRVAGLVAALLCCAAVAACGSSNSGSDTAGGSAKQTTADKSPVVLQLISAKTTGVNLLDPYEAGAQAAVKKINASGGFGGRKVVLDVCNSMLTPAGSTTCAHKAIANDPVAMWGCEPNWSATGQPIFAAKGIPSFNCLNSDKDFTDPTSFSIFPGGAVEFSAGAKYICTMPDVKSVSWIAQEDPGQMKAVPQALTPIFEGCGKKISYEWFPFSAVDVTPYVTKVMQSKPDFVMMDVSGAAFVKLVKAFEQQGLPAEKIYSTSIAMDENNVLKPAGSALNGTLWTSYIANWDDASDPTIAAYRKATAGEANPLQGLSLWGWIQMYWFRTVAQQVGADKFDASSLMHFMKTANGVPIPGSRTLVNPGPAKAPAMKQPYLQILRYVNGKFQVVLKNTDKGWVNGVPKALGGR